MNLGRDPLAPIPQPDSPRLPKAHLPSVTLKSGIHLARVSKKSFRLSVEVSDSQLAAIRDSFGSTEGISSVALATALKDQAHPKLFRFYGSYTQPILDTFTTKDDPAQRLAKKAIRLVSALGSFMRDGKRGLLQATDLLISVVSPNGARIDARVIESPILANYRSRISDAIKVGPGKGKEEEWGSCIERAQKSLERVEKVFRLHSQGYPVRGIARKVRMCESNVTASLEGKFNLAIQELESATKNTLSVVRPNLLPRTTSRAWAAVMGAYLAVTQHGGIEQRLAISTNSEARIRPVENAFRALELGLKVNVTQVKRSPERMFWGCFIQSQELQDTLSNLTDSGRKVPWIALGTNEEKVEFLRMYFLLRGDVSKDAFSFSSARHEVAVGLASILEEFQIVPAIQFKNDGSLLVRVYSPFGLKTALELGLFSPEDAPRVSSLLEGVENIRPVHLLYARVCAYKRDHPRATFREVAEASGAPETACYNWLTSSRKPYEVHALETLAELKRECRIPKPEVAAWLYRRGFPIRAAMLVAENVTLKQVKQALGQSVVAENTLHAFPANLVSMAKMFLP